jgi:hypothetical protein
LWGRKREMGVPVEVGVEVEIEVVVARMEMAGMGGVLRYGRRRTRESG